MLMYVIANNALLSGRIGITSTYDHNHRSLFSRDELCYLAKVTHATKYFGCYRNNFCSNCECRNTVTFYNGFSCSTIVFIGSVIM